MAALVFRAEPGSVFMQDGPREASLTERQCNALLDVWEDTEAHSTFNDLYEACQLAGFIPRAVSQRAA